MRIRLRPGPHQTVECPERGLEIGPEAPLGNLHHLCTLFREPAADIPVKIDGVGETAECQSQRDRDRVRRLRPGRRREALQPGAHRGRERRRARQCAL